MLHRLTLIVALILCWTLPAGAQDQVRAKLFARAEGQDVKAVVQVKIEPGWHIYHEDVGPGGGTGFPTELTWSGTGIVWSPTRFPEPVRYDERGLTAPDGSQAWAWVHEGEILLYALGRAESGAPDLGSVEVAIDGLVCQKSCIPFGDELIVEGPGDDALFAKFPTDLVPGAQAEPPPAVPEPTPHENVVAGTAPPPSDASWNDAAFPPFAPVTDERGLGLMLLFAFLAGVILNVMPCVLPVVSIKVLSFVQQAGESKARVLQLGLAFSAGILVVFAVLACLAAFAAKGWGEQFQDETFKIAMIAIVFGFSLSLFDVYELGVPSKVGEVAAIRREGAYDAFFKGVMATVLATPCSGPFLGSTLAWALRQPPHVILAVFMTVGLGMAAPYVLLTSNTALLKFVPKPGAWMHTFKHVTGFLLLGTVVFLMISVKQELLVPTIALLLCVAFGCWWWGRFATFEQGPAARFGTLVVAAALVGGGAWISFRPLKQALSPEPGAGSLVWHEFDPARLEELRRAGTPVMLEFTADWCANCKWNEIYVYNDEEIVDLVRRKGVVPMQIDLTGKSPRSKAGTRLRDLLGAKSIPFLTVHGPGDAWMTPERFYDIVSKAKLVKALERFPDTTFASQ